MAYKTLMPVLLLLPFFSFAQTANQTPLAEHYQTEKFDCAIFPPHSLHYNSLDYHSEEKEFTPTHREVDSAELALIIQHYVIDDLEGPASPTNLNNYQRQYFGYIDYQGHKILYINAFWRSDIFNENYWLEGQVRVADGGSHFWQVKFDLTTCKLFELRVNGR